MTVDTSLSAVVGAVPAQRAEFVATVPAPTATPELTGRPAARTPHELAALIRAQGLADRG
ncbi:hypothetical protein GCM10029978_067620 [Actinoallomurus acanthiterrae]